MKIIMFYHSLVSDWNHGNAHFLRGIAGELILRNHSVKIYEPENGWSKQNLIEDQGIGAVKEFHEFYPGLNSTAYNLKDLDPDVILEDADLVIVHEWNEHALVRMLGEHRKKNNNYRLLFHDTHHRSLTDAGSMAGYDLSGYDGVLAYGEVIRQIYLKKSWIQKAWTWHEAADVRIFHPVKGIKKEGDLIWIGNWGDEERTKEIYEFLLEPVKDLDLKARVHGVRYPAEAVKALAETGIEYNGWIPNYKVPDAFAKFRLTLHIPRRPYVEALKGIPTIRPFEALACGIPLISSPWEDSENLFRRGEDFLIAHDGSEMKKMIRSVLNDKDLAESLSRSGLETILNRHTCAHRVDQLMDIYKKICRAELRSTHSVK